jgi:hypothetical protein
MVIIYNNINFKDRKRDKVMGYIDTIQSITIAAIILCPELLTSGLY